MFEGVLYKKKKGDPSGHSNSDDEWKSFWCTIEGEMLKVFQLPGKDVAPKPGAKLVQKGFLSLTGCKIVRRPHAASVDSSLEFSLLNENNNSVDFKAANEEDLERWIGMIETVSGIGMEELSEIDFDLGNELNGVEDAIAHPKEAVASPSSRTATLTDIPAVAAPTQSMLSATGRLDIKRMDSASSISSTTSLPVTNSLGGYGSVKTAPNSLSRGALGSVSTDHSQPIQSMYKILVQRSISKSNLQSSPNPAIGGGTTAPVSPQLGSAASFEIFGAIIEKAGQGVGFGMLISENSIPGATYITEIRSSARTKWVGSAVRDSDGSRASPASDSAIREARPGDQVLRIQDEDIRGYEIKTVAKLLGSFHEGAYVRFVFARGAHVKDNDVFPLPSFPNMSSILPSSADNVGAGRLTPRNAYYHRAKSSNDLSPPSTPTLSPTAPVLTKSQSQSFSSDASHLHYNVILQKGPAGVGLGISIVEDSSAAGARGALIKEVFRTVHVNYISERAGGSLHPGDKILSIDRDDFQNAPIAEIARRLSMVQEYGTVRLKMQRSLSLFEDAPFATTASPGPLSPPLTTIFESPTSAATTNQADTEAADPLPAQEAAVLSPSTAPKAASDYSLLPPASPPHVGMKVPSHSRSRSDGSSAQSQAALSKRSDEQRDSSISQTSHVSAPIAPRAQSPMPSPRPMPSEQLTPREMASMVRSPVSPALARINSLRDIIQYDAIIEKGPPGIGFGILIAEDKSDRSVVVKKIKPNLDIRFLSPSANGNIQEKDVLMKIDDEEVDHWEIEKIVKLLGSVSVGTVVRFRFQRRIYIADPAATAASLDRLRSYSEASNAMMSARQRSDSGNRIAYPVLVAEAVAAAPSHDSAVSPTIAASVDSVVPIALSSVGYPSKDDEELIEMIASASSIDPMSPISAAASSEKMSMSHQASGPIFPFPEELDSSSARTPDAITDASVGHTEVEEEEVVAVEEEEEAIVIQEIKDEPREEAGDEKEDTREEEPVSAVEDADPPAVVVKAPSASEADTDASLQDFAEGEPGPRESLPEAIALRTETFEIGASATAKPPQILDPFSCPVCKSVFAPAGDSCPCVLTCGHSVCAVDTRALCSQGSFACPVCSSSHRPEDYPGGMPAANHGLMAILVAAPHLIALRTTATTTSPIAKEEPADGTRTADVSVSVVESPAGVVTSEVEAPTRVVAAEEIVPEPNVVLTAAAEAVEISAEAGAPVQEADKEVPSSSASFSASPGESASPNSGGEVAPLVEVSEAEREESPEEVPQEQTAHMCSGCGEAAPAYFCEDCKTDFCETCDADVHKFKLFRSHQRCPIEVKYLMMTTCAEHGEVTKLFCEQPSCKKFVCSACCSGGGAHSSHDCRPAKDILTEKKRAINSQLQAERDVMRQLEALKASMQASLGGTASQAEALAGQVEQDFASARALLDALERRIVEGIRLHAAEKSGLLSSQLAEVSVCLDNLTASSAKTDAIRGLGVEELLAHSDDRLGERREASARALLLLGSSSFVDSAMLLECGRSCAAAVRTLSYSLLDGATLVSSFAAPAAVSASNGTTSTAATAAVGVGVLGSPEVSS